MIRGLCRTLLSAGVLVFGACGQKPARVTFEIDRKELHEASGLAASRQNPGWIWTHNDSGSGAWLYAIGPDHELRFRVKVVGAKAIDWEDIAIGPGPGGRDLIYIADTGRNLPAGKHDDPPRLWVIPEPRIGKEIVLPAQPPGKNDKLPRFRSEFARSFALVYPDKKAPDVEAVFLWPGGKAIGLVSKEKKGRSHVYASKLPAAPRDEQILGLDLVARIKIRVVTKRKGSRLVTAADVTPDKRLVLLTYTHIVTVPLPSVRPAHPASLVAGGAIALPELNGAEACVVLPGGRVLVACEGRPARFVEVQLAPGPR